MMLSVKQNLNEFHEEVNIFGIKFNREIFDSLVQILNQRVWIFANGKFVPSYFFNVLLWCTHFLTYNYLITQPKGLEKVSIYNRKE